MRGLFYYTNEKMDSESISRGEKDSQRRKSLLLRTICGDTASF